MIFFLVVSKQCTTHLAQIPLHLLCHSLIDLLQAVYLPLALLHVIKDASPVLNTLVVGSKSRVVPLHLRLVLAALAGHVVHKTNNVKKAASLQDRGKGPVVFAGPVREALEQQSIFLLGLTWGEAELKVGGIVCATL